MSEQMAVLVIDMLEDFIAPGAPLEVPAGRKIVPALAERLERARAEGTPVIYLCDAHAPKQQAHRKGEREIHAVASPRNRLNPKGGRYVLHREARCLGPGHRGNQ